MGRRAELLVYAKRRPAGSKRLRARPPGLLECRAVTDSAPPLRPRWPWITLLGLQVLQLLSLGPWLPMAGLSFMAFDAPGSTEKWQPWAFVLAMWSYPLWLLLAGIVSWVLFAGGRRMGAVVLAAIFTLPAFALTALLLVAMI